MRETKEITYIGHEVVSLTCDKCGGSVRADDGEDVFDFQEFHTFSGYGGYGSCFRDSFPWTLDLCDTCAHAMFGAYVKYNEDED